MIALNNINIAFKFYHHNTVKMVTLIILIIKGAPELDTMPVLSQSNLQETVSEVHVFNMFSQLVNT